MEGREIEAGTQVLIAAPANPMPAAQSALIADVLAKIPDVVEAHLPLLFVPGAMAETAQVLVVVFKRGANVETLMQEINFHLARLLTEDSRLDVFPLAEGGEMIRSVRAVGCQILGARGGAKPWWKFW
jgi:hypothetical protein